MRKPRRRWRHLRPPRYLAINPLAPLSRHRVDPHYNAQGDWQCRTCGWIAVLS